MNAILTFDTSQVIHISGFLLSLLGSVMIFGPRLGTWIKTTFDFTPIHFMIGLLMGLGMTLVLLNWETSEKRDYIVEGVYEPDDIQIPNTIQQPKKKIPPPPPPSPKKVIQKLSKVIEYVEADVVEEPTKVVDQDETAAPAVDTVSFTEPAPLILPKEEETDIGDIVIIPEQMPDFLAVSLWMEIIRPSKTARLAASLTTFMVTSSILLLLDKMEYKDLQ